MPVMVCDKANCKEIVRPSLQLLNTETDFPFVCVLRPTKSIPNFRKVTLERAESSDQYSLCLQMCWTAVYLLIKIFSDI